MGFFDRLTGHGSGQTALLQENTAMGYTLEHMTERLAELELALEDAGWTRLSFENEQEFSREGLKRIVALSRLFFLKNPLINRAVTLQSMYVWGQGVNIKAAHPEIDAVIQAFMDDPKNQVELTGHQARTMKEQDLQVEGNLFFVLFPHKATGRVRVRTIPTDEVVDIITNPEDRKEPWYYKRSWTVSGVNVSLGLATGAAAETAYYPDWRHNPTAKPMTIGGSPVEWDSPVYHVRVGGLSNMRFGVPETYSGLDWARAYKEFLEDWATIVRAYAKFAFQVNTKGGKKGIAAIKSKLGTTVGSSSGETNPPPLPGSTVVMGEGNSLTPVRTAGATTSADDGRRMLLMVAAATGLPESFFGDVSVGTLATAKSLDRPTELKFRDRQELWRDVLADLFQYVIDKRATAILYRDLSGSLTWNEEHDEQYVVLENDPETGEEIDRHIDIDFPGILEHDVKEDVGAIITAATLDGKALAGTIDAKTVSRLLLTALGQDDIDDLLDEIFPEGEEGEAVVVAARAEAKWIEAVTEMREALRELAKSAA